MVYPFPRLLPTIFLFPKRAIIIRGFYIFNPLFDGSGIQHVEIDLGLMILVQTIHSVIVSHYSL